MTRGSVRTLVLFKKLANATKSAFESKFKDVESINFIVSL